tara:strand:+ start:4295 stop:4426 length:132 start_codon:yes stop_codon:yes gene_type:complete
MANKTKEKTGLSKLMGVVIPFVVIAGGLLFILNRALNKGKGIN